jgi:hypothetical protein
MSNPNIRFSDNEEDLLQDKYYKKYNRKKLRLKKKHNFEDLINLGSRYRARYKEGEREQFLVWIKECMDLMLTPDGDFQNFLWNNRSARQRYEEEHFLK